MASAYQKIDAGQSDWLTPLNTMLKAYGDMTADSGWIPVTLLNGFTNSNKNKPTRIRLIGKLVIFDVDLSTITINTAVCVIPKSLAPLGGLATLVRTTSGVPFGFSVGYDGYTFAESSATRTTIEGDYLRGVLMWMIE